MSSSTKTDGGGSVDAKAEEVVRTVMLPTYKMEPDLNKRFNVENVRRIATSTLQRHLKGVKYTDDSAMEHSQRLSDDIKRSVLALDIPRYKVIVQVTIGERKDQAIHVASRCLWDASTDNYASASFQNEHLWAVATVFGMYTD